MTQTLTSNGMRSVAENRGDDQSCLSVATSPAIVDFEPAPFFADPRLIPPLAAMTLRWPSQVDDGNADRRWEMPLGTVLTGSLPIRFGIQLLRMAENSYFLEVVWNRTGLSWFGLSRNEIYASNLPEILKAVGSDLEYMLAQPVVEENESVGFHANLD